MIQFIDLLQCILVAHGLVDSYQEGERWGQLNPLAQLLVTPVEAVELLSQVQPARTLQRALQQLGLVGLVPVFLVPVIKNRRPRGLFKSKIVTWKG